MLPESDGSEALGMRTDFHSITTSISSYNIRVENDQGVRAWAWEFASIGSPRSLLHGLWGTDMSDKIIVELPRGVPSVYYIATFGYAEFYGDEDGLVKEISERFDFEHPAYKDRWNIKVFNRENLTLSDVPVSRIARMIHKASKIYLKKLVDDGTKISEGIDSKYYDICVVETEPNVSTGEKIREKYYNKARKQLHSEGFIWVPVKVATGNGAPLQPDMTTRSDSGRPACWPMLPTSAGNNGVSDSATRWSIRHWWWGWHEPEDQIFSCIY
jgi:hypothetical protein